MHIGFNVSDAALPDLAVIFLENKCQLGVRFPDTADQILFLRTWSAFSSVLPVGIVT